ncbi:MAG: TetR/AcrR family transcriptional regulator [bacterium]
MTVATKKAYPPGRIKIVDALIKLLEHKEFNAITTAEIAKMAGVTEALIYKYFKDKRDLLHQVLSEYLEDYHDRTLTDLKGIKGAVNKIRKLIWTHFHVYSTNRVFARILLIEVRNHQDYFKSETYSLVRDYSNILLDIIEEGIQKGEIRDDIPPKIIRQSVLGSIEHICLTRIIFNREIPSESLTEDLCNLLFYNIEKQ